MIVCCAVSKCAQDSSSNCTHYLHSFYLLHIMTQSDFTFFFQKHRLPPMDFLFCPLCITNVKCTPIIHKGKEAKSYTQQEPNASCISQLFAWHFICCSPENLNSQTPSFIVAVAELKSFSAHIMPWVVQFRHATASSSIKCWSFCCNVNYATEKKTKLCRCYSACLSDVLV